MVAIKRAQYPKYELVFGNKQQCGNGMTVAYQGTSASYAFTINQDKTINPGNAQGTVGNGLNLSSNKYWLLISPSYYGSQFLVSCNQSFTMTNLYQEQGSNPTIYVSSNSPSRTRGSNLNDYVNSSCFGNSGSSCDYASTLGLLLHYLQ